MAWQTFVQKHNMTEEGIIAIWHYTQANTNSFWGVGFALVIFLGVFYTILYRQDDAGQALTGASFATMISILPLRFINLLSIMHSGIIIGICALCFIGGIIYLSKK